jgi:hypothetical protein
MRQEPRGGYERWAGVFSTLSGLTNGSITKTPPEMRRPGSSWNSADFVSLERTAATQEVMADIWKVIEARIQLRDCFCSKYCEETAIRARRYFSQNESSVTIGGC